MAENKMKEVAQLLGVELNEEFNIKNMTFNPYRITKMGLFDRDESRSTIALHALLTGEHEIEKSILNKSEKTYLEAVLRPFKDRVEYIKKASNPNGCYIYVNLFDDEISFPYFEKDTMYKGMEVDKRYTLKELGLFEDE